MTQVMNGGEDWDGTGTGVGHGTGTGGSYSPGSYADANSTETATLQILLGEGEMEGLVDGLKSIYLDNTPIQNTDGTLNFSGLALALVAGTNTQAAVAGITAAESEVSVGVQVKKNDPVVRSILTSPDAVRIRVAVPTLKIVDRNSGNSSGHRVTIKVERQCHGYNGDNWEEVDLAGMGTISGGPFSSRYTRSYRVDLPIQGSWQIRVSRVSADDADDFHASQTWWDAYTEITDAKLRYPNSAVLSLRLNAKQFQSIPQVNVLMKLSKVQVPANYTPPVWHPQVVTGSVLGEAAHWTPAVYATSGTGTHNGAWDGTFKTIWTANPAWTFMHAATSVRSGCGDFLSVSGLDKWALYAISQWCDEMVSDGHGGTEPRMQCNLYLQNPESAIKSLMNLASVFNGVLYSASGLVIPVPDKNDEPVALFTNANVEEGNFHYEGTAKAARHTACLVKFQNPALGYQTDTAAYEDPAAILRYGYQPLELQGVGCASEAQAMRLAKWSIITEQLATESVSFTSGLEGSTVRPGDVIQVSDQFRSAASRFGGRLVSATLTTLTLDAPITLTSAGTIHVQTSTGLETRTIVGLGTMTVVTVSQAFSEVPAVDAGWLVVDASMLNTYRVLSVSQGEGIKYAITALLHDPLKYDLLNLLDGDLSAKTSVVRMTSAPAGLVLAVTSTILNDRQVQTLHADWTQDEAESYLAEASRDWGTWIPMATSGSAAILDNVQPGSWRVRVTGLWRGAGASPYANTAITVIGSDTVPVWTADAQADATSALATISDISADGIISNPERPALRTFRAQLAADVTAAKAKADVMGVTYVSLSTAWTAFVTNVDPVLAATTNSTVVKATFDGYWTSVRTEITNLLGYMAYTASNAAATATNTANSALAAAPLVVTGMPTLPSATYPAGKLIFETVTKKLYRSTGTAWETSVVAAADITGTLAAAQIASLAAGQITGTLTSAQIASIDAAKLYGTVSGSLVDAISATKVSGTLTSAQIASLDAAKLSGTVSGALVDAIAASKVSGTLSDSQIAAVSAAKISGTLVGTQLASGAIDQSKLASGLTVPAIVATLPTVFTAYPQGSMVVLTTDNKLYRSTGTAWTASVPTTDLSGTVSDAQIAGVSSSKLAGSIADSQLAGMSAAKLTGQITGTQVSDSAISTSKIATGAITAASGILANACIGTAQIQTAAVGSAQIANLAVGSAQIADAAISNAKIGSLDASKITSGSLDVGRLAAGSITAASGVIANLAVGSAQIQDAAITNAKVGSLDAGKITTGSLDASRIAADSITSTHIAASAITAAELAAGSVVAGKIASGSIVAGDISAGSLTADRLSAGTITAASGVLAAACIGTAQIADAAITNAKVGSLDAGKITTGSLDAARISASSLTADKLVAGTITAASGVLGTACIGSANIIDAAITNAKIGSLDAGKINTGTLSAGVIAVGSLSGDKIAANTLDASKIIAGSITSASIATDTIVAGNIAAGAIGASEIAAGAVTTSHLNFTPVTGALAGQVVAAINATTEGIRISGNRIQIDGNVTFGTGYDPSTKATPAEVSSAASAAQSAAISSAATDATTKANNAANASLDKGTYLSAGVSTINGGLITANTITTAKLNFTPVQTNNIVASINATAEGIRIQANRLVIDGTVQFGSGYDPSTKATPAEVSSAASAAQSAAISTASGDATTKANAAQSTAISTASGDATTKANAAQSAAISTASADATSKANAVASSSLDKATYLSSGYTTIRGDVITTGSIQAAQINSNAIQTTNYAEDGSGYPTAGARMQLGSTALKVAAGGLQIGSRTFTDYWFRLLQGIDGSSSSLVVWRGNNDTTVNGGAPVIADTNSNPASNPRLLINTTKDDDRSAYTINYALHFQVQPITNADNLDSLSHIEMLAYRKTGPSTMALGDRNTSGSQDANQGHAYIAIRGRRYVTPGTPSDPSNASHAMHIWTNSDISVAGDGTRPLSGRNYPLVLLCRICNVYGNSTQHYFTAPSAAGIGSTTSTGRWTDVGTNPPYAGGSTGTTGGGGGSVGGGCPAPWVKIALASGLVLDAASLYDGAQVLGVDDNFAPAVGTVREPRRIWVKRMAVVLADGRTPEFSHNHRVAVVGRGWVEVRDLVPGDTLVAQVPSIVTSLGMPREAEVISFSVDGCHTYFSDDVLSHNAKILT